MLFGNSWICSMPLLPITRVCKGSWHVLLCGNNDSYWHAPAGALNDANRTFVVIDGMRRMYSDYALAENEN